MYRILEGLALLVLASHSAVAQEAAPIERLLIDIASEDAAVREHATSALIERGMPARCAVLDLWRESEDPEVQARAVQVLQGIDTEELIRLMTWSDGGSVCEPPSEQRSSAPRESPEGDLPSLLQEVNASDWRSAERALVCINDLGRGAVFDPPAAAWAHAPEVLRRLFVLIGRDRLAWGLDSWGALLGDTRPVLPQTLLPLDHEDVEALLDRDPGEVIDYNRQQRPGRRRATNGGIYTYCFDPNPPHYPIERTSPTGVLHQFAFDREGALVLWRVLRSSDDYLELNFVSGRVASMRDASGLCITFR